jgi:hypothetical protein
MVKRRRADRQVGVKRFTSSVLGGRGALQAELRVDSI